MSNFNPFNEFDPYFYAPGTFMEANKDADLYADPILRLKASALTSGWGYDVPQGMPSTTAPEPPVVPEPEVVPEQEVSKDNILFMFLGGLPNSEHYNKFLSTRDDSLHIVVHPMRLPFEPTGVYKEMQDRGKLFVVDDTHHVKTSWATFSLVSATVFMMQYALVEKNLNIKKCVLLSGADMPLYNYNIIKTELLKDDKSMISFTNNNEGGYARNFIFKSYNYEGGIFDINSMNYVSQWMALDIKHIKYFFNTDNDNKIIKTYKKRNVEYCNGKTNIIEALEKDSDYQKYIDSHVGVYDGYTSDKEAIESLIKSGFCVTGDESYFGSVVKFNLDRNNEEFLDNIKTNNISKLEKNTKNIHLKIDEEEKKNIFKKYIYAGYGNTKSTEINRCWYGSPIKFNEYNLKYRIKIFQNEKNKDESDINKHIYYLVKNNIVKTLKHSDLLKLKNENQQEARQFYESLSKSNVGVSGIGAGGSSDSYNFFNVNIKGDGKTDIFEDYYSISSTYTDWSSVNPSPSNMFRGFNYKVFTNNKKIDEFEGNILDAINKTNPADFIKILIKNKKLVTKSNNNYYVTGPGYHPAEYEEYSIQSILNAINLIIFFKLNEQNTSFLTDYMCAFEIYNRIIFSHDYIARVKNNFYEIQNLDDKKFGYKINFFNLSNALNYGALFIRKVTPNGDINNYTDKLLSLSEYKLNKSGVSLEINKHKIVEQRNWDEARKRIENFKLKVEIEPSVHNPKRMNFDNSNIVQVGGAAPSENSITNFNLQNITNTVLQKDNVRIAFTEENTKDLNGLKYFAKGFNSAVYKIKLVISHTSNENYKEVDCILKIVSNKENNANIEEIIDKYYDDLKIDESTKKYFIDILYYGTINRNGNELHYYICPYYDPYKIEPYNYNISDKLTIATNILNMLKNVSNKNYYITDLRLDNITILENKQPILIDYDNTTLTKDYDTFLLNSGVWHSYYDKENGKNFDKVYQVILCQLILTYFLNIKDKEWSGKIIDNLGLIWNKNSESYKGNPYSKLKINITNMEQFNKSLSETLYTNIKELLYDESTGKGLLATSYENNLTLDQVLEYIDNIWIKSKSISNSKYLINFKNKYYKYKKKYFLLKKI